jgi:hypothetical protein
MLSEAEHDLLFADRVDADENPIALVPLNDLHDLCECFLLYSSEQKKKGGGKSLLASKPRNFIKWTRTRGGNSNCGSQYVLSRKRISMGGEGESSGCWSISGENLGKRRDWECDESEQYDNSRT